MKKLTNTLILAVLLLFMSCQSNNDDLLPPKNPITPIPPSTTSATYYVSPLGNDANNGLTQESPLLTLTKASQSTKPGDLVYFMNGTFIITKDMSILVNGLADKYITYKALAGAKPKFFISGNVWNSLRINASYIKIEGIEFEGDNANLTYADAFNAYNVANGGGSSTGVYNCNGIMVGGPKAESKFPHHVEVRNCIIHDFSGGGLGAIQADYITFEGNTVYNNAWYTMYGASGISILTPFNLDTSTGIKNIIRNNKSYNNKTTIPWISTKKLSDGNGIIIDVNNRTYGATTGSGYYTGRTLVENNISYNNGGSGIHTFDAQHVDILNNTAYNNAQVIVDKADIYANWATDVKIMNNIMYAKNGGKVNLTNNSGGPNVVYANNIYFNGTVNVMGTNDKVADPKFISLSIDPFIANFQLQSSSPAINAGSSTVFSAKDILGIARPKGTAPDCGAYESY